MEGVLVSAKKDGSSITTTVVSDQQGAYSFPNARLEPGKYTGFQRLKLVLVVASNPGRGQTESKTEITFTALNTDRLTKAADICPEASK